MNRKDIYRLFETIKVAPETVTLDERAFVMELLKNSDGLTESEIRQLIYVVALTEDPAPKNLQLIESYLDQSSPDYVRQGALNCLVRYWGQYQKYNNLIIASITRMGDEGQDQLLISACSAAFQIIYHTNDAVMKKFCIEFITQNGEESFSDDDYKMLLKNMLYYHELKTEGTKGFFRISDEEALELYPKAERYITEIGA